MKSLIHLTATALAFAVTAAAAQPNMPASGEMPFAAPAVAQATNQAPTRAAVRATALAKDLEVGDLARPSAPPATPETDRNSRMATPKSLPLSGDRV